MAAAVAVKDKAIRVAADKLEVAEEDLRLANGRVELVGAPEVNISLGTIARMLMPGNPELLAPPKATNIADNEGLAATAYIRAVPSGTSVFAVHLADVAVDIETGKITVERYLVAADVGRAINPRIVEGQLVGGVVMGLGGTLAGRARLRRGWASADRDALPTICSRRVHDAPPIRAMVIEKARSPEIRSA